MIYSVYACSEKLSCEGSATFESVVGKGEKRC